LTMVQSFQSLPDSKSCTSAWIWLFVPDQKKD